MATLTIELPEAVEARLKARAKIQGKDVSAVAQEILVKSLEEPAAIEPRSRSHEEWCAELEAFVNSHTKVDVQVDHGRDRIYEGRGR